MHFIVSFRVCSEGNISISAHKSPPASLMVQQEVEERREKRDEGSTSLDF